MQSRLASLLIAAWPLFLGSAQADAPGDVAPVDRWDANMEFGNAIARIATPAHDATILISCSEDDPSLALMVSLASPLAVKEEFRTVTMIFDGAPAVPQSWFSTEDSYGTTEGEVGFPMTIAGLTQHRTVEFVLSEDGKEIDRHSFTLNGAGEAITAVLRACNRNG